MHDDTSDHVWQHHSMAPLTVSQRINEFNSPFGERVALKYAQMTKDPYRFYRGTCHLFYKDLSKQTSFPHQAPHVWGCGDLHLENVGSYKADNRRVYFDLNDFDEAQLLPATWELARVVTSIVVAFTVFEMKEQEIAEQAGLYLAAYCKTLRNGKAKHIEARLAKGIVRSFLEQASRRKSKDLVQKLTTKNKDDYALLLDNKKRFAMESGAEKEDLLSSITDWLINSPHKLAKGYVVADACQRNAGMGGIGAKRFLVLLQNTQRKNGFLLLDVKEGRPSSLQRFNPVPQPQWASEAERIAGVQARSQYDTVALMGTFFFNGASYVVHELQPEDDKLDFRTMINQEKAVSRVLKDMAMLTASAHLRSAGRQGSAIADELILFARTTEWQEHLLRYSVEYAKQVSADYQTFNHAIENGLFKPTIN